MARASLRAGLETVIRRAMANDGMPAIFKTFPLASDLLFLIHRASLIQRSGI